jgi:transposase
MTTMKNYIDEMINSIPTPETLQQEQLERIVKEVIDDLRKYGHYEEVRFHVGSREAETNMAKRVEKIFTDKGYTVYLDFYAKSNSKVFLLQIEM